MHIDIGFQKQLKYHSIFWYIYATLFHSKQHDINFQEQVVYYTYPHKIKMVGHNYTIAFDKLVSS